ncbi:hypothetical protein EDEG_01164 [Edhazardia aedis USNM 41457]|uniref:Uncharacterized protein n=1 Tax=Edhazardia aedis (strain USNM 41457) TaxID=1003232 RepID=J9DTN0_EDHAE|nr:hypothetical protein EDEG_01164 [Edhazardia aedis USNM 41457]|eukprot:EJW04637.1 hypothetical protein EDEG_01164 [Edhazardia aedis USNM 41457]
MINLLICGILEIIASLDDKNLDDENSINSTNDFKFVFENPQNESKPNSLPCESNYLEEIENLLEKINEIGGKNYKNKLLAVLDHETAKTRKKYRSCLKCNTIIRETFTATKTLKNNYSYRKIEVSIPKREINTVRKKIFICSKCMTCSNCEYATINTGNVSKNKKKMKPKPKFYVNGYHKRKLSEKKQSDTPQKKIFQNSNILINYSHKRIQESFVDITKLEAGSSSTEISVYNTSYLN